MPGETTFSEFIIGEQRRSPHAMGGFTALVSDIRLACKRIAYLVGKGALAHGVEVYLRLDELVDLGRERERLGAERDRFRALLEGVKEAILPAGVPVIIVGGIVGGVFTATEAAVIATVYALLITVGVYRTLRFARLVKIFAEAGHLTGVIPFCVATASIFGWRLAF